MGLEVNLANLASQVSAPGSQITFNQNVNLTGAVNTLTGSLNVGTTSAFGGNMSDSGPQYFNATNYLSVNQGMILNFYSFAVYGGNQYMHFKTNLRNTTSQMYCIEARGYDYGNGCSIAGNWVGYMYQPNGTSNPISNSVTNWGNQAFCNNQYLSSDGYLVLVGTMASYYCSCTFNSYVTAQGNFDFRFTSYSQTTSSTGAF
jgi:hypothetical protein